MSDTVKCACGEMVDLETTEAEEIGEAGGLKIRHYQCPNCLGVVAEFVRISDGERVWAGAAARKDLET